MRVGDRRAFCTGGTADSATDPWMSGGGDGTVYFGGLALDLSTDPPTTAVVASHSGDGGPTWASPATVAPPLQGNETDAITGSPTLDGHAYMVWANFSNVDFPRTNTPSFSRTTDGGATWSPPVLIDQPSPPETGEELPEPHYPGAAVTLDGTAYIAFEDNSSATSGGIGVARSQDGGRTWTSSMLPGVSAYAFEPAIAVDSHGTVGVTWYDLRNDRPGDAALTADVWFAHSHNHGGSWRQTHVAGPTDLRTVPVPGALNYVGEYQGLAGLRNGFAAGFTLAAPQAQNGPTDIFSARIQPGEGDRH